MQLMRFGGAWMFSPFQRRSATARREPRLITFLLSLVRVHLSNCRWPVLMQCLLRLLLRRKMLWQKIGVSSGFMKRLILVAASESK